jgi:hypothetical protein
MTTASSRFLHVANGHCTTRLIDEAGIPGTLSVWADVLHEGPVPAGLSDQELLAVRASYLAETPGAVAAVMADLTAVRLAIGRHESYDEIVLWYEHDLFDQLNLIQVLDWIGHARPAARLVSLICIGSFPGHPRFKGLGELTAYELAPLIDTRENIGAAHYALAERAWSAFRAPDPGQIEQLLQSDTSALPFLAAALQRHLEELPSTSNGLSRTERRLMELAGQGPIEVWDAFAHMHDLETVFFIADSSFWHVVQDLAAASPALITLNLTAHPRARLPRGMIVLTDAGREVLTSVSDRVRRCGLQRWLGGVHLEGGAAMWRWDAAAGRIVLT